MKALKRGWALCPGCGKPRKAYRDAKGWRMFSHNGPPACFDPYHQPRIPDREIAETEEALVGTARILVARLAEYVDPFPSLGITGSTGFPRPQKPREDLPYDPDVRNRSSEYHISRILQFVRDGISDPIDVDNRCEGMCIYPIPILLDGHHRLAAALLRGDEYILAHYGGRVDLLDYLKGIKDTAPQDG